MILQNKILEEKGLWGITLFLSMQTLLIKKTTLNSAKSIIKKKIVKWMNYHLQGLVIALLEKIIFIIKQKKIAGDDDILKKDKNKIIKLSIFCRI